MKKILTLGLMVVILSACSQQATPATEVPTDTTQIEETTTVETETTTMEEGAEATVVEVAGDNFTFDVPEIRVKQGDKVAVNFTNKEGFHDFVIDDLSVNTGMVAAGSSKEVMIPTDKPGTYEYYCSVGDHRAKGMKGTLIIE